MTEPIADPASTIEVGQLIDLEIGDVATGGVCVARHEGRVVFVRHTLPGERVTARVLQIAGGGRFLRADAVTIEQPSPQRVAPACPVAGPGGCGGCDWQHASLPAQRVGKAAVIAEQFRRLAHIDLDALDVQALPGEEPPGLGWRSRVRFAADATGALGFRAWHSEHIVPVADCPLADAQIRELRVPAKRWPAHSEVEVAGGVRDDLPLVIIEPGAAAPKPNRSRHRQVRRPSPAKPVNTRDVPALSGDASVAVRTDGGLRRLRGRTWVRHVVRLPQGEREFRVTGGGFWQGHPGAAQALLDAVLRLGDPQPGQQAIDLYAGAGLFAAGLAERVGAQGRVIAIEGDERAVADARRNLHDLTHASLVSADVLGWLRESEQNSLGADTPFDLVVLDPPRRGAGEQVVASVLAGGPRRVVYVACDPASLARDTAFAAQHGYTLSALEAFDLFPMTHHVECVALWEPSR